MQAATRAGPAGHRAVSTDVHSGSATGQRGWNEQPDGRSAGSGGSPPSPRGRSRDRSSPITGKAKASAWAYGCCAPVNTSCAGPSSTTRPAYITASRWQVTDSTDRSWLIMIMLMPRSATRPVISRSTWAWIITSSAVVGSSATIRFGEQASAMAIMMRCFCPPDSSCG